MVTLDEDYRGPDCPDIDEADSMTSSAKPEYDTKAVPWDYRADDKAIRVGKEVEAGNTKLSSAAKMVASEMLKYGYQPKNGLGPKSSGIVESIQLKHQRGTYELGYEPASGRDHHELSETIFVPKRALIPDQAGIDDIIEGISNLFVAMAGEEEGINLNKMTIRDVEPGDILQNWTTSPSLFQPESW
ncbi:hypothetical protein H5410_030911 [Solanum commersonii]|uniref:G-patch domain-containing protein n=1 Tax=Solanum commersonii TaxID=4109 RepID=A0A9J5YHK3_SOLCO|nr:hypothetical protein H5410_030911 [Solanum commersonii]